MALQPATEPIEELVHAAMAERLRTIKGGSTYWTTPALVTRSLLPIDQYEAFPVLGVVRASGTVTARAAHQRSAYEHWLRVAVWGYVRGDHAGTPGAILASTWLAQLRRDATLCLAAVPTLGDLVHDLAPDPDAPVDTDDGALEPEGYFRQIWLARATETLALA